MAAEACICLNNRPVWILPIFLKKRNWRVGVCMSEKICKFVAYFMRASVKMAWLDPATLDVRCNIILSSL